jgi:hypothetical protein
VAVGLNPIWAANASGIAANVFTAPAAGWYQVGVHLEGVTFDNGNNDQINESCSVMATVNGTTYVVASQLVNQAKNQDVVGTLAGTLTVPMATGEAVSLSAMCTGNFMRITAAAGTNAQRSVSFARVV